MNAAGKLFLNDARRVLQDVTEAKLRAERIALGKAGTLRIGIATALSWHGLVVDSFRKFRSEQPDAQLELHHLISIYQIEGILTGRLDVGFVTGLIALQKGLVRRQFAQDRMLLAVPKGHLLTKRKRIQLRQSDMFLLFYQLSNRLEPLDREVLALRHFEQLSNSEAAQALGLRESAASKRYVRALERLKDILEAMPGYSGEVPS